MTVKSIGKVLLREVITEFYQYQDNFLKLGEGRFHAVTKEAFGEVKERHQGSKTIQTCVKSHFLNIISECVHAYLFIG